MPGMGGSLKLRNPLIVEHFSSALTHQILLVLAVALLAAGLAVVLAQRRPLPPVIDEPVARRILRLGFGGLWIIAGILQLQPSMPIGLPSAVVLPTVATAPGALNHLVSLASNAWLRHPVLGASAVVWLELGLGVWLLVARDGWWSRAAGWASAAWGAVVWVIGNGLGGMFVGPLSWMFGAPGASLFYVLAGVALGVPPLWLSRRSIVRWTSRGIGVGLVLLAALQAWPGRGFWGEGPASVRPLSSMAQDMGALGQPGITASLQHWVAQATLDGSWIFNAVVVVALALSGVGFLMASRRWILMSLWLYGSLALADWVMIQDFGVFGGISTDINSMVPSVIFLLAAGLALLDHRGDTPAAIPGMDSGGPRRPRSFGAMARIGGSAASAGVVLVGALVISSIGILPGATSEAAVATGGTVADLGGAPAPDFQLIDQRGEPISLATLRGHTVVLSFIDAVCTSECPIEAQEMRAAARELGWPSDVLFLAISANGRFDSRQATVTFTRQEGFDDWAQWRFATGSPTMLRQTWQRYGVNVAAVGAGAMVAHGEAVFIIDATGKLRATWNLAPGPDEGSVTGQSTTALIVEQIRALR